MSLTFQRLDKGIHDLRKVAELIYDTDQSIMPLMFGGRRTGIERLRCLVQAGSNVFGYEYVYVALDRSEVVGIVIGTTGEEYEKADEQGFGVYYRCIGWAGSLRLSAAWLAVRNVLTKRLAADDFYLSVLCVDSKRRGAGIGGFILENIARTAMEQGCNRLVLDVSFENDGARRLYERRGFRGLTKKRLIPLWAGAGSYTMAKALRP